MTNSPIKNEINQIHNDDTINKRLKLMTKKIEQKSIKVKCESDTTIRVCIKGLSYLDNTTIILLGISEIE